MKKVLVALALVSLLGISAPAANVTLTGSDTIGQSSFNAGTHWSDAAAPSAGNDYVVDGSIRLRTPASGGAYVFAGDSLTIQNSGAENSQFGMSFKGTGSAGSVTINNLILGTGGQINAINGVTDVLNLYGNINVAGNSAMYAKQGPMNIYSAVSGSSTITVTNPDADTRCKLWFYSSANTFTGNIVNKGRFGLVDNANLNFVIGAAGINNSVSGTSQKHATFDGDFIFDLSGAGSTIGDSWAVITTTIASTYYGTTFNVAGFSDMGDNTWRKYSNSAWYEFSETTGALSVIPEPATMFLLGLGGLLVSRKKR